MSPTRQASGDSDREEFLPAMPVVAPRPRVLVVQPSLQPPGGGNAVAAWMIEALKGPYDLSVLSWVPLEPDAINEYYGTSIALDDVRPLTLPGWLRKPFEALPTSAVLLKASMLFRYAKRMAPEFDAVVCGHNEADFGPRSIQYVHYPARLRPRPKVDLRWYHPSFALEPYYALCERVARLDPGAVSAALTLANSTWTAGLVEELYRPTRPVRVVHPPVAAAPAPLPWSQRENGFVCIGRLAPEKELERVVEIVGRVRRQEPDAHIHLIGSRGPRGYLRRVRQLAALHASWVHLHEDATREQIFDMIARHRYGVHGMREEHFGIAPAEAAAGGCVVFVPNGGGQVDIVGREARLIYDSTEDAVDKITSVMADADAQAGLRAALAARRAMFSTERFMETIRRTVAEVRAEGRFTASPS